MQNKRKTGAEYEEKAASWLEKQGMRILEKITGAERERSTWSLWTAVIWSLWKLSTGETSMQGIRRKPWMRENRGRLSGRRCTIVWNERFPRISRAASMWSACWEIAQNI